MGNHPVNQQLKSCRNPLIKAAGIAAAFTFSANAFATTTLDVMALYTDGVQTQYGSSVETRLNQIISVSNKVYADSNLDIELRLVHQQHVDYSDSVSPEQALTDLTCDFTALQTQGVCNRGEAFSQVDDLREQYGADLVLLMRPYANSHNNVCGIAWIGGYGTNGDFSNPLWRETGMGVIGMDGPCGDWVTSHELGHNMGLTHSSLQDSEGGTFPWAWGYGESDNFATIMGYAWLFGSNTQKVYNFSSPDLDCFGSACGIDHNEANGADAVHALGVAAPQIAAYTATVITDPNDGTDGSTDGETPEETQPSDDPDEAKQAWLDAKEKLAGLKTERKALKTEQNTARTAYKQARRAYNKAYNSYQRQLTQLNSLYQQAMQAINDYNASSSLTTAQQQRLYNAAISKADSYNAKVLEVSASAEELNALLDAYNSAKDSYEQAQAAFEQAKAAVAAQKQVVADAYQAYQDALNG
ncbi:reprolysin-like metallopeptidase [Thalassomonas sp. RHCl1]|uniref:reprolysin-like metallopeptidase n=1 Tax=Thalassomonas sp. RHCl1 TaxID=2995320 RepID=UPI00248C1872|nr:M12 family metallo-peptidase [Thalassomonas sp. RHCl1]